MHPLTRVGTRRTLAYTRGTGARCIAKLRKCGVKPPDLVFGRRHRARSHPIDGRRQSRSPSAVRRRRFVLHGGGDAGAEGRVEAAAEFRLFGGGPIGHVVEAEPKGFALAVEGIHVPIRPWLQG